MAIKTWLWRVDDEEDEVPVLFASEEVARKVVADSWWDFVQDCQRVDPEHGPDEYEKEFVGVTREHFHWVDNRLMMGIKATPYWLEEVTAYSSEDEYKDDFNCKKEAFLNDPITVSYGVGSEFVGKIECKCKRCREEE